MPNMYVNVHNLLALHTIKAWLCMRSSPCCLCVLKEWDLLKYAVVLVAGTVQSC